MKRIAIIGSGIAGACTAHALAQYGATVTVFEAGPSIAHETSGNPAAVVKPRLDLGETPAARFYRAAFIHAVALYESLDCFTTQGLRDTSYDAEKRAKLQADRPLPADWLDFENGALWHKRAGVVSPRPAILKLLEDSDVRLNTHADKAMLGNYDAVVVAAGRALVNYAPALPLSYRAGQVDWMPTTTAVTPTSGEHYVIPHAAHVVFGTTHDYWTDPAAWPETTEKASGHNLEKLHAVYPHIPLAEQRHARTGLRVSVRDRMPVVGKLDEKTYVIGALAGRGFTTAPLLGEMLASHILGLPLPVDDTLVAAVAPARFS